MDIDKLREAYYVARSNKRRSADSIEFELHSERNLMELCEAINQRTLSPTAYAFVTLKPRPREIFACSMEMRVVHHYLDIRLRPLIEARLTDRTFNNRVGYGQDVAVNTLISDIYEVSRGYTRDAYIIKIDIHGYFPNAILEIVYKQLSRLVIEDYEGDDKDDVLYLLERSIYSYPQNHCYRKSPLWKWQYIPDDKSKFKQPDGIGGAIGHLIWQNAMNYYLNDFDHYILDELGLHYCRFVDDMVFVVENKEAFLPMIEIFRKRLKEDYGCELHPHKFYCQHWSKGVEFIGTFIKMDRVYPSKRIVRNAFQKVAEFNKCIRQSKVESFLASINSYLGVFKRRNGYAIICNLLESINSRWWKYVEFDKTRLCLVAKEGYKHRQLLSRKYNLHFKKYDRRRKKHSAQRAVRQSAQGAGCHQREIDNDTLQLRGGCCMACG